MSDAAAILIVGASAAGVSAARTLRANGFDDAIVLIDADPNLPYERPPLSKRVLEDAGSSSGDFPLLTAAQAEDLRLTLNLGRRVTRLETSDLSVALDGGDRLSGRAILLATGGRARRLALPGADLVGVHVIRDFADAQALRADLRNAKTVAVIGGGLIGTEAAVAIARTGKSVIWLDGAAKPLAHIFPEPIADHLIARHLAAGVPLRAGVRPRRLLEREGRVAGVELEDGEIIAAEVVVMGVGMAPDDSLARDAGLETSQGVHVGADQRTSAPGIYAAGDVAAFVDESAAARRRHEHWRAAEEQGANAARVMLGLAPLPPSVPWFWSDQGPHHVEMAGRRAGDTILRQGAKGPIAFEMAGDRMVGVASVDEPNAVRIGLRLIQSAKSLDRAILADPAADLRPLLKV